MNTGIFTLVTTPNYILIFVQYEILLLHSLIIEQFANKNMKHDKKNCK